MSGSGESAEDRTEAPSQKRQQEARDAGQLPVSRDLTMLASLGAATLACIWSVPTLGRQLANQCANLFSLLDRAQLSDGTLWRGPVSAVLVSAAMLAGAVAIPAAVASIACVLLQTQFYIGGAPIRFQLSRISPVAGLGRLFSVRHLLEFLKSCLRLVILCALAWSVLGHAPLSAMAVMASDIAGLLPVAGGQMEGFARPVLMVLACFAAADVLLVRFQHTRSIRMTRQQVRLENRDSDGDPFIKAKLRRIRNQRAKRRMMAKVKKADVVITNPTHYAVALTYERGSKTAPRVVAKGADLVAARIRDEATAHGVPIVPNPPLARALFLVELDQEIPGEHYKAVAEVIAFVWRLKARLPPPARAS
jgi:flagellar biosynthetic protein FlhB